MKENMGFIIIFSCMMISIMYLSGCTRFDTSGSQAESWRVTLESNKDGDCSLQISNETMDDVSDGSITVQGKGT